MSKRFLLNFDYGLIIPVFILTTLSLVTLFSINVSFFKNQLIFLIVSFFAMVFFSQVDYLSIQKSSLVIYIFSIVILALILFMGIESRGSIRWFDIFGFRIQFSEVLKPFLAISLSTFLSNRESSSYKSFFLTFVFLSPIVFLIFIQPDLGNAIIYGFVVLLTSFVYGFPLRLFLLSLSFMLASLPFFWNFLHNYQKQRIISFLDPKDSLGISYNVIQSLIAVGSGMIIGKGLGQGTQSQLRFLPERHTDFIFATLTEGLGFIGSIIVVLCFAFILYRIFLIFLNAQNSFCKIFAVVSFFLIMFQFFINVGMNIGILPIVGITLPFVSYGGSSLLSSFIFLGILSAISKSFSNNKVLEIK